MGHSIEKQAYSGTPERRIASAGGTMKNDFNYKFSSYFTDEKQISCTIDTVILSAIPTPKDGSAETQLGSLYKVCELHNFMITYKKAKILDISSKEYHVDGFNHQVQHLD